jgi:hypothetical protein
MQRLEVSGALRQLEWPLGVKGLCRYEDRNHENLLITLFSITVSKFGEFVFERL